jgi:hypothetical protein
VWSVLVIYVGDIATVEAARERGGENSDMRPGRPRDVEMLAVAPTDGRGFAAR